MMRKATVLVSVGALLAGAAWGASLADLDRYESLLSSNADDIRAGSEYRQAVIQLKQYDRCIKFFEGLVAKHPAAANAYLNFGFAYVDKIPDAGAITQVILANTALAHFSKSIEIKPSWIALYTRGNSYLYWPKIFGKAPLGVKDLEDAMRIQKQDKVRSYHVRSYTSLGDGYWKMDNLDKAREVWQEGAKHFPHAEGLKARLSKQGEELAKYIDEVLDPNRRVDTNLHELWEDK